MAERRRRLIEVAFPLEEVSAHSRREKNVRHGHISTLHIWWARRPLAACRAFIYASLVDDPETDAERDQLLKEVADLASWDAVRKPDQVVRPKPAGSGLTGRELLERARQRILACNGGKPPRLLDPFAGGGAIPLEALRLGCEVEASDLNPVAVLILKGTVEYPQKYGRPLAEQRERLARGERDDIAGVSGEVPAYIRDSAHTLQSSFAESDAVAAYERNPLAADVRYWGNWILERARAELAEFYPPDPDGSIPIAWLWSRNVPCPSCGAKMPMIRQFWLARQGRKNIALSPVVDRESRTVDFAISEGASVSGNPSQATTSRGDTVCLVCRQVLKGEYVRQSGRQGNIGAQMTAVILEAKGRTGKGYRPDADRDTEVFLRAAERLDQVAANAVSDLPLVPDEPIAPETLGLRIDAFGFDTWGSLFNGRQLLALATFSRLVGEASAQMQRDGCGNAYSEAVTTYMAFLVDKAADFGSTLCVLNNVGGRGVVHTFGRQTLSMIWDYAESNPFCTDGAGWMSYLNRTVEALNDLAFERPATVIQADATMHRINQFDACITDPPYYNAIDYAGLSDFFYVWLKRSLPSGVHSELQSFPLTPKRQQAIMASESNDPIARQRYVDLTQQAFLSMQSALSFDGMVGVVFAHTDPDAWATLIDSLLSSGLTPSGSWPIDTEREGKISAAFRANLQTSVWMACQPRDQATNQAFLGDVLDEMRRNIRTRLLSYWSAGIRGADFFISAIGPALSVFGRHSRVLRPDGQEVSVREFLEIVRRESTHVALEQVLQGTDLGVVDPLTQQYMTWVWSYSRSALDAGESIALCLATGADYGQVVRLGSIAVESREGSKKVVKLRTIRERGRDDESLGQTTPARPSPLIDQLQYAAHLWSLNKTEDLGRYRESLGESRWMALRTLGQAVAECLPDGDDDRRLIFGLLASNVRIPAQPSAAATRSTGFGSPRQTLPGFQEAVSPQIPLPSTDED
jgi:putative DNA methylase